MIPLKLKLKNFLSYGPEVQTIDFAPYNLVCLSGKNGHGKSALLDAITWAIWGQARKVGSAVKADANLLRLGQTQMMVCLDFLCNGQTYRIKREYAKTYGKPKNDLDFGVLNKENDTIVPLTDKTIRATQSKIEQTLRLTFDAFSNSAFLRQGQANEFSKKSPKERKEILAQILGLQQYELVRKRALELAKEAEHKRAAISVFQEKISGELEKKATIDQEIKTITKKLQEKEKIEATYQKEQSKLEKEKQQLSEQTKQFELLAFQKNELEKKIKEHKAQIDALTKKIEVIEKKRVNLPDQKNLETQKTECQKEIACAQKAQQDRLAIKELLLKQKQVLQAIEKELQQKQMELLQKHKLIVQKLKLEHDTIQRKQKELQEKQKSEQKKQKTLELEQKQQQKVLASADTLNKQVAKQEAELTKGKEQYQNLIARGNMLNQQLHDLHQKQHLVGHDNEPCCPLCEQNLSTSRKRFLYDKFVKQKEQLKASLAQVGKTIKTLKITLLQKHEAVQKNKKEQEQLTKIRLQKKETEKKLTECKEQLESYNKLLLSTQKECKALTKQIAAAEKKRNKQESEQKKAMEQDSGYKKAQQKTKKIEEQLGKTTYDEKKHAAAQKELQTVEKQLTELVTLTRELALQEERKKQLETLRQKQKEIKKDLEVLAKKLLAYKPLQEKQNKIKKEEQTLFEQRQTVKTEREQLFQQKGACENQQKKIKELEQQNQKEQKKLQELQEVVQDYQEIAAATSKNGIQALLIENAIPEVEQEANHLLSKLTNNQAQIFIESLRDLKKGGTRETLDIKISDAAGIRPYELFSGGEAFRIDFALRIAISKLLARRAGTALQTLIIDEGFGSQDQEGLAQIMDAIYKIQDDFVKIIIVSHLSTLKDQFPVHFSVQKDARGSHVTVMQLG